MIISKGGIESLTTVHGASHFASKKGKGYFLWTLIMFANLVLAVGFIMIVQKKYHNDEIVTEINTNCEVGNVPFPAVSICNFNLVSLKDTKNIQRILKIYNRSTREINEFFQTLPLLTHYGFETYQKGNFTEIMKILKSHFFTMDTIMEEIHQKCNDLLVYCSFNRKVKNCKDVFSLVRTSEGYCCAFNYREPTDGPSAVSDGDFEYYDDNSGDKAPTVRMISTSESGRLSGLFVFLNVEPNEYPTWSLTQSYGAKDGLKPELQARALIIQGNASSFQYKILISDPNDYPEANIKYEYLAPGDSKDIKIDPMIFKTENALRRVDISKRNCLFHDEVPLELTDRYSTESCESECKMTTFLEHCGCVPYKYPQKKRSRICELEDLVCLHNVTGRTDRRPITLILNDITKNVFISKQEMKCHPICYVECSDKKYSISSITNTFISENVPTNITNNLLMSSLRVYYTKSTCNCYKMTVYIDISYFIATYGGVFSLFFGGSIITLVELFYLFINYLIVLIMNITQNFKIKLIGTSH